MITRIRSSDSWIIAGLAIVLVSAKLVSSTLPRISQWVSGIGESIPPADVTDTDATQPVIVVEAPESVSPSPPIIVMPNSTPPPSRPGVCPHGGPEQPEG
jgi:hypothetical protein